MPNLIDDVGDTHETATPLALGQTFHGAIGSETDLDVFKLVLEAGTTYRFDLNLPRGIIRIDSTDQLELAFLGLDGKNAFTPTATGTYYATVIAAPADYSFTVGPAVDDYSANAATSARLTADGSIAGTLEAGGNDRDWIAIDLSAGSTTFFKLAAGDNSSLGLMGARVLDAAGNVLATATLTHFDEQRPWVHDVFGFTADRSGTYFIEILQSNTAAAQEYTLSATPGADDYGNTAAAATQLALDTPIQGRVEIPADVDVFAFEVHAGVDYGFSTTNQPQVELGYAGATSPFDTSTSWSGHGVAFHAVRDGVVYLNVSSPYGDTHDYTLQAVSFGADDIGASVDTAATLVPGQSLHSELSSPLDADLVHVHLLAGRTYAFQWLGASSDGGTLDTDYQAWSFALEDAAGSALQTLPIQSADPRLIFTPGADGDYYIRLRDLGGATGSYTLSSADVSDDHAGPQLVAQSHAQGATGIALADTRITLSFDEPVDIARADIVLLAADGHSVPLASAHGIPLAQAIDNRIVVETASVLTPGTYTLTLPHGAIHDLAGNAYAGAESITFATILPGSAGSADDDLLAGGTGLTIDGGAGLDTVVYTAARSAVTIEASGGGFVIRDDASGTADTLHGVERLLFPSGGVALDIDGHGGQAYRLYQAAFDRSPDSAGVGYWMYQLDQGMNLEDAAHAFIASAEFQALSGDTTTDGEFVDLLYQNVLHRTADADGQAFWGQALSSGTSREQVLVAFSESPEDQANLASVIGNGFDYAVYH